ncbi:MAG: hypothetical protein KJZ53_06845 [Anaerolineales bacterium]|nr:hypothetical protein [Anaerolineales bacterium]
MSIIKSFSVGYGSTFYIDHNTDNFSMIDCYLSLSNRESIVEEMVEKSSKKGITRFISTHPDEDHFHGLKFLDDKMGILNFYCVMNSATKELETEDFVRYCKLRDSEKAFYLYKGCSRKWMNQSDEERSGAGLAILWPKTDNPFYKAALGQAAAGGNPNNTSIILRYKVKDGVSALWMGDLEAEFMELIADEVEFEKTHILFAPHHGRISGRIPEKWLKQINPDVVVIGEAPGESLDYQGYKNYNKITQNSAGDITFDCHDESIDIYVSDRDYTVDFLQNYGKNSQLGSYLGTLNLS